MSSVPHAAHALADALPAGDTQASLPASAWAELSPRLEPLLLGPRLDNLVDLAALVADLVDFVDPAMVEKLSGVFEETVAAHATVGGALRLAAAQSRRDAHPPGMGALWALARDADTRRGVALLLRTLQVIGRAQAPLQAPSGVGGNR